MSENDNTVENAVGIVEQSPAITSIKTFAQLEELCSKPIKYVATIDGNPVEIPCRRLTPVEQEKVAAVVEAEIPPSRKDPNTGKDVFDTTDQEYLKRANRANKIAKSLIVYMGCPLYQELEPKPKNNEEVAALVYSKLTPKLVDGIYERVISGGIGVEDYLNFT